MNTIWSPADKTNIAITAPVIDIEYTYFIIKLQFKIIILFLHVKYNFS